MIVGHSSSGLPATEQNSWFYLIEQIIQVLKQQSCPGLYDSRYDVTLIFCNAVCFRQESHIFRKVCCCRVRPRTFFLNFHDQDLLGKCNTGLCIVLDQQWFWLFSSPMLAISLTEAVRPAELLMLFRVLL